jgi:hypothetical protein
MERVGKKSWAKVKKKSHLCFLKGIFCEGEIDRLPRKIPNSEIESLEVGEDVGGCSSPERSGSKTTSAVSIRRR